MSDEMKNVIIFPSAGPALLPPHPDDPSAGVSSEDYQAAKNLRALYQLIYLICQCDHSHYTSLPEFDSSPPRNYSAKLWCTGDGTSWRVVMGPDGIKGMAWYFTGLKRLEGMFDTAVIQYWDAQQCEALVEALEKGGIESLPKDWRFVVSHGEVVGESVYPPTTSATQDGNMMATEAGNGGNDAEINEKSAGGL